MATEKREATKKQKTIKLRQTSRASEVTVLVKRNSTAAIGATATIDTNWGATPFLHLSNKAGYSSRAEPLDLDPPGYDAMFQVPFAHSLMNANLASIKTTDPAHPGEPGQTVCQVDGVEANVVFTGICGTKSQNPDAVTGYGIPAVSILQDVLVMQDGDHMDCLVLSTIPFPFSAGTTQSQAVTQCNQAPNVTSDVAGYAINELVIGALIAAANATGQQWSQTPFSTAIILDELFLSYDKVMRTSVGAEINQTLSALNGQIPFQITTGDLMAPFLNFSVTAIDKVNSTIDMQFNSVGFSTMLRTVDPQTNQVVLGTALSLQATGQGHLTKAGLELTLSYQFNVGGGFLPLGPKYAAQINAMIPKLEDQLKALFLSELDGMLFALGGGNIPMTTRLRSSSSATSHLSGSSSHLARSSERRSTPLIP